MGFQLPSEKIVGLAKFFLGIGIPGDAKDLFNQVDSLAYLESNRHVLSCYFLYADFSHFIVMLPCNVLKFFLVALCLTQGTLRNKMCFIRLY